MGTSDYIWMDGTMTEWAQAKVHIMTHSLHYGFGAFEGIRGYEVPDGCSVFRLSEHIDRLIMSANLLGMEVPFSKQQLIDAVKQVVQSNRLQNAYIRPLIYLGDEGLTLHSEALKPHVAIAAWDLGRYLGSKKGLRVKLSRFVRPPSRAKATGLYLFSMSAIQDAKADGYDNAILCDSEGLVSEGPGENLFLVESGRLVSPESPAALDGITRDSIMELAASEGIEIETRRVTPDDLYCSDEMFFCGTASEIAPIGQIGSWSKPYCDSGLTAVIARLYADAVRGKKGGQFDQWVTVF